MSEKETADNVNENLQNQEENLDTDTAVAEIAEDAPVEDDTSEVKQINYAEVVEADIKALKEEFPELSSLSDICELNNPLRYAALRDLGLSPSEAYLATAKQRRIDNRAHLGGMRTVAVSAANTMSDSEMSLAREIFTDVPDAEIRRLYKRVTK